MGPLEQLHREGWLSALDLHFAGLLGRLDPGATEPVLLAAALASRAVRRGHTCLDLSDAGARLLHDEQRASLRVEAPEPAAWQQQLRGSPLVGEGEAPTPLVLDPAGQLYLFRYWQHERSIARAVQQRAVAEVEAVDGAWLRERLDNLFAEPPPGAIDGQRLAAAVALLQRLTVISGGPGTGKTYTVTKLLALLIEAALQRGERLPRITLLAPTGKAAARLAESIKQAKQGLSVSAAVLAAIPEEAATLHRGLGSIGGSTLRFRHGADHPLPADLVLVDEASMVDVGLMARLVEALAPRARLVLLGDRDQLASVEAGSVLGDICNTGAATGISTARVAQLRELAGLELGAEQPQHPVAGIWDSVVQLRHSYRYRPDSGIAGLARAINAGDAAQALELLGSDAYPDVSLCDPGPGWQLPEPLLHSVLERYGAYLDQSEPLTALAAFNRFRLLCAHRRGARGVQALNSAIEKALAEAGRIAPRGRDYLGRPVMVTRNDYSQQLFNGDVGLTLADPDASGSPAVCFVASDGSLRKLAPGWLPAHETVYAMTVHKSQGSEFDEVAVLLPDESSPVLSRELLYTAVTRAREQVVLYGTAERVREAIGARIERSSGLRARLWKASS